MGRSRRAPFRAWGIVISAVLVLTISRHEWRQSAWLAGVLVFYLLFVRRTRCRAQNAKGTPCRHLARGFVGSCDHHSGLKRGLPSLVGTNGLPVFMWRRPQFASEPVAMAQQGIPAARQTRMDVVMMWLAVFSLLVASASFVRDLIAG